MFGNKYRPKYLRVNALAKLSRKQRMQVRIRKLKPLPLLWTVLSAITVFLSFLLFSALCSHPASADAGFQAPENSVLVANFAGDVMLGRNIATEAEKKGYDALYSGVSAYWNDADLAAVNLESAVISGRVANYEETEKSIHLYCSYDALNSLVDAGVNLFSCANNHAFDYGEKAVTELATYMQEKGLMYSGIGLNFQDAARYTITEVNGIKIAFLSITDVFYKEALATEEQGGLLSTGYGDYNNLVNQASKEADLTIVYMHWGEENEITANEDQQRMGHQLIDAGADIVIGSHPHVVQEAERYRDGMIFYSLGNFIFDQGNTFSKDSMLVQFVVSEDGSCFFEVIPMRIQNGAPSEAFGFYAARINHKIASGLDASEYYYNNVGHIVIPAFTIALNQETSPVENP